MSNKTHYHFMQKALFLAQRAEQLGEVPVGAVVVREGKIIGEGWNQSITLSDPTAHAEILAIRDAAEKQNNYRLPGCTLYVTLEPCSMCAGSFIHARIGNVIFGAQDEKSGAVKSVYELLDSNPKQHRVKWQGGVLAQECSDLLSNFFKKRRLMKKMND